MSLGLVTLLSFASLDVRWLAPESCPSPDLSILSASASGSADVRITSPSPATWVLELAFVEPFEATRRLELGSCSDARRAARALLILGLSGADAFNRSEVALPVPPMPVDEPRPPPPAPEAPRVSWSVRAGALASLLVTPAPTPRLTVSVGLRFRVFELELSARAGVPATFTAGPTAEASVSIWPTVGADLAGCWSPSTGVVRPGLCATVVSEWWQLRGAGVSNPVAGNAAFVSAGGQARIAFTLGAGFQLGASASLRGNVRRPSAEFAGTVALAAGVVTVEAGGFLGWSP